MKKVIKLKFFPLVLKSMEMDFKNMWEPCFQGHWHRVPTRHWKSIELWNQFSRPWKSVEFGQNVYRLL